MKNNYAPSCAGKRDEGRAAPEKCSFLSRYIFAGREEDDLSNYGNCTCGKGRREREGKKKINSARDCACSNEACARCTTVGKILEKSNSENWGRGGKKMHIYPGNRASARFFEKAAEDVDGALFHPTSFRFFPFSRWVG